MYFSSCSSLQFLLSLPLAFQQNTNDGTILYDVDATDADFGGNAQILYFISDELVSVGCP